MRHTRLLILIALIALAGCDDDDRNADTDRDADSSTAADTPPDDDAPDDTADTAPDVTQLDADLSDDSDSDAPLPSHQCRVIDDGRAPEMTTVTLGGWTVTADATHGTWAVTPPDGTAPVLEGPGTCVDSERSAGLPAVRLSSATPGVDNSFGAFRIRLSTVSLAAVTGDRPRVESSDDALALIWSVRDHAGATGEATLRFSLDTASGGLRVALESSRPEWQAGEIALRCRADESFFGLGTQATGMDLRGTQIPLWTQEQGIGKPADGGFFPLNNIPEAAYAPMGVWHSSEGYSAVIDHDAFTLLDVCRLDTDRLLVRSYPDLPAFVLVPGASPRERLARLTEAFVGRLGPLPRWVLAPWNDAVGGPHRLREVATRLREANVPSSAIWAEDWAGVLPGGEGYRLSYAWAWDPTFYPELPQDISDLHAQGFAFLAYFNPFVVSTTAMFEEGEAGGYLIQSPSGGTYLFDDPGFRPASLVDLTNPDARQWLGAYLRTAADELAIDGWMADFAEWLPVDSVLSSGESAWRVHNRYPLMWQAENLAALGEVHADAPDGPDNFTFFARSGWASTRGGTAGLAPTLWAGDQNTDWRYDDGFPTVVPIGAHVGLAGVAIYGHDIAGYTAVLNPPTSKELYLRWASLGAFTPLMRTHHGSEECANWAFDRDAETLEHHRRQAVLHTLLMPLLTTLVKEARDHGLPLWRHPYLVEPGRAGLWQGRDYQVFLGDDLLLAPVLTEGATTRQVRLPETGWWPLFGHAPLSGESLIAGAVVETTVEAPVTELPVFVRPGTTLILLGEPVDSFYTATDASVSTYDDVRDHLRIALYPDAAGSLRVSEARDLDGSVIARAEATTGIGEAALASAPSIGGVVLPRCADSNAGTDCHDEVARIARVHGTQVTLELAGGATLLLDALRPTTFEVGLAGDAWGAWAEPTVVTDLHPDIAPPCEPEGP